jgi:5-methylcytosine-specific restriction protein A
MSKLDHLYDTARWRRLRAHQLRERPLCRFCLEGRGMATPATVADHVIAHKGDIDKFWLGDLQSLCHYCHVIAKAFIEQRGYSPLVGLDGYPVDKSSLLPVEQRP